MKKILALITAALFVSCGSSTSVVTSWKDPSETIASQNFKKVMVVALMKDEATRRNTENRIAATNPSILHTSYQFLNETTQKMSQEEKLKVLHDENFDGVITMRLVSKEKETDYVPGTTGVYYGGYPGYGGFYGGAFGGWYGMYGTGFYSPGYYDESTYYMIETNIFSLTKNKLLWTGTTKTLAGSELGPMVDDIMNAIKEQMQVDGSIAK
ncbi:hypothetical protein [Flavobacterium agrisoli]|uniref:DUF4136 domain-containing protein n=1 Tax=Flavobacterium agrisoli TaxID=2793066 RepID=A0A934UI89_9FLAO|nr:hypothetical protein [Flavobacterium agrisoli]MBK0368596.1 hypothetical protein [Flavobacterium agrisoli]